MENYNIFIKIDILGFHYFHLPSVVFARVPFLRVSWSREVIFYLFSKSRHKSDNCVINHSPGNIDLNKGVFLWKYVVYGPKKRNMRSLPPTPSSPPVNHWRAWTLTKSRFFAFFSTNMLFWEKCKDTKIVFHKISHRMAPRGNNVQIILKSL